MSNIVQIKRGNNKPDGLLAPYELGYDINKKSLYVGGPLEDNGNGSLQYGNAQDVLAKGAYSLVGSDGNAYSAGSNSIPVYLDNGIIKSCSSGDIAIGMKVESALRLENYRTFSVNLQAGNTSAFDGSSDVSLGVQGTLPISKGGTGATTALLARKNLELGSVATYDILPIDKGGTNAIDEATARSNLGIKAVATYDVLPLSKGGTGSTADLLNAANHSLIFRNSTLGDEGMLTALSPDIGAVYYTSDKELAIGSLPVSSGGTGANTIDGAKANLDITLKSLWSGTLNSSNTSATFTTSAPQNTQFFVVVGNTVSSYAKVSLVIPAELADGLNKFQLYSDGYYISFTLSSSKILHSQQNSSGAITDIYYF